MIPYVFQAQYNIEQPTQAYTTLKEAVVKDEKGIPKNLHHHGDGTACTATAVYDRRNGTTNTEGTWNVVDGNGACVSVASMMRVTASNNKRPACHKSAVKQRVVCMGASHAVLS